MAGRRLTLNRESLGTLESDELASIAGAISAPHPHCVITSYQHSYCGSCDFACTMHCLTRPCPPVE